MNITKDLLSKIELHYYFSDSSHSMNASILNKCEQSLLGIFKEISSILNARLQIEAEALKEGGLVARYVARGRSELLRSVSLSVFQYVLPLELDIERTINEEDKDELKLNIERLRREIREHEKDHFNKIDTTNLESIFRNNLKIIKLKSNFYRQLSSSEKVTKFSVQPINFEGKLSGKPVVVARKQFDTFMLVADTLKPETDKKAIIEVISPVLSTGSYKWKGIYAKTGRVISFAMRDLDFKEEVIKQSIPFKNGTQIQCVLESSRKLNEFGEQVVTGYSVLTVTSKQDDQVKVEIVPKQTPKKKKEVVIQQLDLFGF